MDIFEFLRGLFFYSGYLMSRGKAFPQPLSAEEEKKYLEQFLNGDEKAREILIEHNLRLVAHIAKKYARNSMELEDMISIGTVGLIKGINTYDRNKGKHLVTYIARCIQNEILMFLRSEKKTGAEVSLADPIGEDKEGNQITLIDILHTGENSVDDVVFEKIETEKVFSILDRVLTEREKAVISMRYGLLGFEALPQRVVAERLGISRSYISRIEKKALGKLNKALEK